MDVMEAAAAREAAGHKIIHMEVGQPGTPAPRAALEAVKRALDRDTLGYTVALGLPALRARIARHYPERYGIDVAPERVVVTTGSSAAFVLAFLALFDAGAKVALPSPGYPCYRHILTALGQVPVPIATDAAGRWMPTAGQIDAAAAARASPGLVIASPANPTGTMLEGGRLAEIVAACRRTWIWLVVRRDLPRADLRHARGDGAGAQRTSHRDQQFLEVFLDDGLAGRLAGGAG